MRKRNQTTCPECGVSLYETPLRRCATHISAAKLRLKRAAHLRASTDDAIRRLRIEKERRDREHEHALAHLDFLDVTDIY